MSDALNGLYTVVEGRKLSPQEGSYTNYLFAQGLDKILKKCAEETGEVILAAKNGDRENLKDEVCDLIYHLIVLLSNEGVELSEIYEILEKRGQKIGNLKTFHRADKES